MDVIAQNQFSGWVKIGRAVMSDADEVTCACYYPIFPCGFDLSIEYF